MREMEYNLSPCVSCLNYSSERMEQNYHSGTLAVGLSVDTMEIAHE